LAFLFPVALARYLEMTSPSESPDIGPVSGEEAP